METEHKGRRNEEGCDHALVLEVASERLCKGVREESRDEPGSISTGFMCNSLVLAEEDKKLFDVEPYDGDRDTY